LTQALPLRIPDGKPLENVKQGTKNYNAKQGKRTTLQIFIKKEMEATKTKNSESLTDTDSYKFFTGKTCPKCGNKFPSPLVLQDIRSQCPECEAKVD
jgi:hypothetical protein